MRGALHALWIMVLATATGCENTNPPKSEANAKSAKRGKKELSPALQALETRLAALEGSFKVTPNPGDLSASERLQRIEVTLARYDAALQMLDGFYQQQKQQEEAKLEQTADPEAIFAVEVANAVKAGQAEGPASAAVTVIKAFDFACPYCERLSKPLHELVKEYNGKLRVVYMNYVVHPDVATKAHLYSCAASMQGKYVAFKDAFWEKGFQPYIQSRGAKTESMGEDNIVKLSGELGLNVAKLKADAAGDGCTKRLQEDQEELMKFRVSATPGLFINGTFIGGAIPKEQFKVIIDEKLKIVEASKVPAAEYYSKEVLGKGLKTFRSVKDAQRERAKQPAAQPPPEQPAPKQPAPSQPPPAPQPAPPAPKGQQ